MSFIEHDSINYAENFSDHRGDSKCQKERINQITIQTTGGGESQYHDSRLSFDADEDTVGKASPASAIEPKTVSELGHDGDEKTLPTVFTSDSETTSSSIVGEPASVPATVTALPRSTYARYFQRLKFHLQEEVDREGTEFVLFVACFLSGLIDSIAFKGWGCFVSMQSGNTVFVGLGTATHPDNVSKRWAKALLAVGCFLAGSLFFSRCYRAFGPLRRGTLFLSFALQSILTFVCATLEETRAVPSAKDGNGVSAPIHWLQLIPIGLLAFQSAGQCITSRILAFHDIPTVVLTTLYCDLMADTRLFTAKWKEHNLRNCRIAAALAFFAGAVVGGWLTRGAGMGSALLLAAVLKFSLAVAWAFWLLCTLAGAVLRSDPAGYPTVDLSLSRKAYKAERRADSDRGGDQVTEVRMSFGFSLGDFIAVVALAKKVRKDFEVAPRQLDDIAHHMRSLSIVLQYVDVVLLAENVLNVDQNTDLREISSSCRHVQEELKKMLDLHGEPESSRGSLSRKVKRFWNRLNLEPEDIRELRNRITANVAMLNTFLGGISRTREGVDRLNQRQDDQERLTILDWLTPIDYMPQQNDFISRRQEGTGQWLLDSAEYQEWLKSSKRTLFCPGIPGAGKTILTAIVIGDLIEQISGDPDIGIAYIYCNFRRKDEQKLYDLLTSLLKQLAEGQPSLPQEVKDLYDYHGDKRSRPLIGEISKTLRSVIDSYSRVFIIVDALDECEVKGGCRTNFLSELTRLQAQYEVNLFATSRLIPEIQENFKGCMSLEIRASEGDVRRYLNDHMFHLPGFVIRNRELQEEIQSEIVSAVDGMFLLAQLHLNSLMGKRAPRAIRVALKSLPTGSEAYDHAYEDAMERIEGQVKDQEELAKQVLCWITCAKRPLTTVELQHALAVELGDTEFGEDNVAEFEDIVSVCAGLVTVDEESKVIRLVHYTTQEYFERTQKTWFPNAQASIATICVTYLSFHAFERGPCQTDEEFEDRLESFQLYDYAALHWGHHARNVSLASQLIIEFLESNPKVAGSIQALKAAKRDSSQENYSQEFPRQTTGSHLAAHFGLEKAMTDLMARGHHMNVKDSDLRTPLLWAAKEGHDDIIALLSNQDTFNANSRDKSDQTPLSIAAGKGHLAATKLLLTLDGVDPEARDEFGQTPLLRAAMYSQDAVVELLLDTGKIDPEARDARYGRTPLSWAAGRGSTAIVEKLLGAKGVDPDSKSTGFWNRGRTPLSYAAERGHQAVVKLLVDTGRVDLDSQDHGRRTPLSYAVAQAQTETLQILLTYGANPKLSDNLQKGLLHYAIVTPNCNLGTVRTLLMLGAPIKLIDIDNMTPLHSTVRFSRQDIAELLIQNGVPVDIGVHRQARTAERHLSRLRFEHGRADETPSFNCQCTRGLTPLHYAALRGNLKMVRVFLKCGADPNAISCHGETPLHLALAKVLQGPEYADSWMDYQSMICSIDERNSVIDELLRNPKTDVNLQDSNGDSALHYAPYSTPHCALIVRKVLKKGADVSAQNAKKRRPLHLACLLGDSASVHALLSHGAGLLHVDEDGLNALLCAARSGDEETILAVLRAYADAVNDFDDVDISTSTDDYRRNALHHILTHPPFPAITAVLALLDRGVDPRDRDSDGNSPLAAYLITSDSMIDENICTLLLQSGSDVSAVNNDGLSLAHLCANGPRFRLSILDRLRTFGADLAVLDAQGRTVLHHAALNGSVTYDALRYLLQQTRVRPDQKDFLGKTPLVYAAERAGENRNRGDSDMERWDGSDPERWSRSLEVLTRYENGGK
ncbi:MAG: hypothetical protein M1819_004029 [Sarea resinae]|nr:MAG: hypothetical protein M1819_004029 [Sarea resinae]